MKHKFGVIVLLACAVGLALVYQGGMTDPTAADVDSQTQWLCKSCAHSFRLSARQVAQRADSDPRRWAPLNCQKCREKQAYLALVCSTCQTVYFGRDVPGESGECPKCSPMPRLAAVEEKTPERSPSRDAVAKSKPAAKVR